MNNVNDIQTYVNPIRIFSSFSSIGLKLPYFARINLSIELVVGSYGETATRIGKRIGRMSLKFHVRLFFREQRGAERTQKYLRY